MKESQRDEVLMKQVSSESPLIYLVTGEASGDLLGARLMRSLKKKRPHSCFAGVGGPLMQREGLVPLFSASDLSVMGLFEILPHLFRLFKRLRETKQDILEKKPDIVVTIDAPGFNFRLARLLKKKTDIPLVHYTAPSVWAWKPGRAKKIARLYNHLLALFSFEPPYFERENLSCTFVGHPLVEEKLPQISPQQFRHLHKIPLKTPLLCFLPGSRKGEVTRLLPSFVGAIERLKKMHPDLTVVCPAMPPFQEDIKQAFSGRVPLIFTRDKQEKYMAMASSNAALAASGTVSLELALTKTPMVIGYRMNALTYIIIKRLVKVPYACLVNILLKAPAVPEYLQERCTPENLAEALSPLLNQSESPTAQGLMEIEPLLKNGERDPSELAASQLLSIFEAAPQKVS